MIRAARLAAIGALALAAAGCATRTPAPPSRPGTVRPSAPATVRRAAVGTADYVAIAGSMDLFAVQMAELALARASAPDLRAFASEAIWRHRGIAAQLSMAGRRIDQLPSATLMPRHQALLQALDAATDFDSAYRRQQVLLNAHALQLHRDYALGGESPTMRPVAKMAVSSLAELGRLLKR